MQRLFAASAAVLQLASWQLAGASEASPVEKVVELLNNMLTKGKEEKHAEEVQFAGYKQFCDDTSREKTRAIKEADERIEMLKATIEKNTEDAAQLGKEIAQHDADIAAWTGDKKAATKVRQIEKADYEALHTDYSESVDALQRAIAYLKKKSKTIKQSPSLAQVKVFKDLEGLKLIPESAKRAIDVFFQQPVDSDSLEVSAPEANAYETNLGGVIEMLEKLLDKFIDERTAVEKEEMNAKHAYDMLMQDLEAQIKQGKADREEKAIFKSKKLQAKADAEGDLTDTTTSRDEDHKYLSQLTGTCEQKAADFEQRQQLRTEELEAIQKAIEVMTSENIQSLSKKYQSFAQGSKVARTGSALASLRSDSHSPVQEKVAQFLRDRSEQLNSRMLSTLAMRVKDDPFGKVKKMIKDLIVRLMEEANEEAEHKGWCDTELSQNEQTRKEKTQAVETLHAEIDQLQASVAKLTEEISAATEAVAKLDADMAEATNLRLEEKKSNEEVIKDSQEAQTAIAQAIAVLKEFYARQARAVLLQKKQQPEAPEIFSDEPYRGMTGEAGGVIGMLELIESDFARLEADTTAEEASSQKRYDEFITDSKVDKASKTKDIEHKSAKKQDQEQALTMKASDLEGTQKELDAALAYFEKLKPSCVDAGVTYDQRVARRQEEIESLQQALRILNGEDVAF